MSENIKRRKISVYALKKACSKAEYLKRAYKILGQPTVSLAHLEDSKNLNDLEEIAAIGTSFAYKKAFEISKEMVYASEGKVVRRIKGGGLQVLESVSPRKVTKGDVLIIQRSRT